MWNTINNRRRIPKVKLLHEEIDFISHLIRENVTRQMLGSGLKAFHNVLNYGMDAGLNVWDCKLSILIALIGLFRWIFGAWMFSGNILYPISCFSNYCRIQTFTLSQLEKWVLPGHSIPWSVGGEKDLNSELTFSLIRCITRLTEIRSGQNLNLF